MNRCSSCQAEFETIQFKGLLSVKTLTTSLTFPNTPVNKEDMCKYCREMILGIPTPPVRKGRLTSEEIGFIQAKLLDRALVKFYWTFSAVLVMILSTAFFLD